ncbi:MAG: hypothetical protein KJO10_05630, partial [Gammaproteobacteria bacterium]|nr:hypothetical protein [Gammaproteobacteria bacterium]
MMTEIDLVPGDYRQLTWLRGRVRTTVIVVMAAMFLSVAIYAGLRVWSVSVDSQIATLQSKQAITNQQREALT